MKLGVLFALLSVGTMFAGAPPRKTVALTFDDLPLAGENAAVNEVLDVNQRILAALRRHRAMAIGFVNEGKIHSGEDPQGIDALRLWLKDGQLLGNHTYSHPDFNALSVPEFIADAERGEGVLRQILPRYHQQLSFFRYPFNHTGDTPEKKVKFGEWLSQHHYEVATCTVENSDYLFNQAYVSAVARGDSESAKRIRSAYLEFTASMFDYFERLSQEIVGRNYPQVFLAHANRLNADSLDDLLTGLEKHGYRFVTLAEAQSDPVYATPDNYVGKYGPMWGYRWSVALGKKTNGRLEPEPPKWVLEAAEARK